MPDWNFCNCWVSWTGIFLFGNHGLLYVEDKIVLAMISSRWSWWDSTRLACSLSFLGARWPICSLWLSGNISVSSSNNCNWALTFVLLSLYMIDSYNSSKSFPHHPAHAVVVIFLKECITSDFSCLTSISSRSADWSFCFVRYNSSL